MQNKIFLDERKECESKNVKISKHFFLHISSKDIDIANLYVALEGQICHVSNK